ncbi:MAG TPA: response regulator [Noviherbaspirillum sp.]|nr:response regulator [Noviherbaspirillum sp.]
MLAERQLLPICMSLYATPDVSVKPRVLIADDSRIVRVTLIKHIEDMFDFREALNGEEAWEILLLDPSIRVVITDLIMPKLDGYGLLRRIRSSKVRRIREIPVVVVSGSGDREERNRARVAGATDVITKGIDAAQLLPRLGVLSHRVSMQHEFEHNLDALLAKAVKARKNFVLLNVCVGLKEVGHDDPAVCPAACVVAAVGQLLLRVVRQTDLVVKTGEAEFTLATGSINFDSARSFAQRVCRVIEAAHLAKDESMSFIVSCGLVSLSDDGRAPKAVVLAELRSVAHRRAMLGLNRAITGVVGIQEEQAFERGEVGVALEDTSGGNVGSSSIYQHVAPDLATLLQWIRDGRQSEVLPYIENLPVELQPLLDLISQQERR